MQTKRRLKPSVIKYLYKILIVTIITLVVLILMKANTNFKTNFYKYVYDTSINFPSINNLYRKYFGSVINSEEKSTVVSNEKINYSKIEDYKDGGRLTVGKNYTIPILESGIVVYIGNKDNYNKVVIVQQNNGIDVWYGNINNVNVKLYDYVTKGNEYLYMVFKKNGKILPYKDYI